MESASNLESVDQTGPLRIWHLMRERIEIAGGVLYVDSRIGRRYSDHCKAALQLARQSKGGPPKETRP